MDTDASSRLARVALGGEVKISASEFIDRVYTSSHFHRRLIWTNAIATELVQKEELSFLSGWSLEAVVRLVLEYTEEEVMPSSRPIIETLELAHGKMRVRMEYLQRRSGKTHLKGVDLEAFNQMVLADRIKVLEEADASRALLRSQKSLVEEHHDIVIERVCQELSRMESMRARYLLAIKKSLCLAKRVDSVLRSKEDFERGASNLMDFVRKMLKSDKSSLAEYTMAHWKIICDKAMSKWRPYEKKSAAALGLSDIRHKASGSVIHKSIDGTRKAILHS